jgi:hypothetical protein
MGMCSLDWDISMADHVGHNKSRNRATFVRERLK